MINKNSILLLLTLIFSFHFCYADHEGGIIGDVLKELVLWPSYFIILVLSLVAFFEKTTNKFILISCILNIILGVFIITEIRDSAFQSDLMRVLIELAPLFVGLLLGVKFIKQIGLFKNI